MHYRRLRVHGDPLAGGIHKGEAQRFVAETAALSGVDECVVWPFGKNREGRGRVNIAGTPQNADVAVLKASKGEKPTPKHECCHSCGNGHIGCVNPGHLYWGTRKENVADAMTHGTAFALNRSTGEFSPNAKFSDALIEEARSRMASGETAQSVARSLGIGRTYIYHIRDGKFRNGSRPANDNTSPTKAA